MFSKYIMYLKKNYYYNLNEQFIPFLGLEKNSVQISKCLNSAIPFTNLYFKWQKKKEIINSNKCKYYIVNI